METEKVIYKKDGVKRIQVNEEGDFIEIDLMDIELPFKVDKTRKELIRQNSIFNNMIRSLEKQYKDNENLLRTKEYEAEVNYCKKCREVLDGLLGNGACQKIFGDTNRYAMFDDYFEQLSEVLDNLQLDIKAIKESLINKYKKDDKIIK